MLTYGGMKFGNAAAMLAAQSEKLMKPGKKVHKRLQTRLDDFARGSQSREAKVSNRWEQGGFHRPGSMRKKT